VTILTDHNRANACDDLSDDLARLVTLGDLHAQPDAISPAWLAQVAELCGWWLARSDRRSG
jgi:hypothetical protein